MKIPGFFLVIFLSPFWLWADLSSQVCWVRPQLSGKAIKGLQYLGDYYEKAGQIKIALILRHLGNGGPVSGALVQDTSGQPWVVMPSEIALMAGSGLLDLTFLSKSSEPPLVIRSCPVLWIDQEAGLGAAVIPQAETSRLPGPGIPIFQGAINSQARVDFVGWLGFGKTPTWHQGPESNGPWEPELFGGSLVVETDAPGVFQVRALGRDGIPSGAISEFLQKAQSALKMNKSSYQDELLKTSQNFLSALNGDQSKTSVIINFSSYQGVLGSPLIIPSEGSGAESGSMLSPMRRVLAGQLETRMKSVIPAIQSFKIEKTWISESETDLPSWGKTFLTNEVWEMIWEWHREGNQWLLCNVLIKKANQGNVFEDPINSVNSFNSWGILTTGFFTNEFMGAMANYDYTGYVGGNGFWVGLGFDGGLGAAYPKGFIAEKTWLGFLGGLHLRGLYDFGYNGPWGLSFYGEAGAAVDLLSLVINSFVFMVTPGEKIKNAQYIPILAAKVDAKIGIGLTIRSTGSNPGGWGIFLDGGVLGACGALSGGFTSWQAGVKVVFNNTN